MIRIKLIRIRSHAAVVARITNAVVIHVSLIVVWRSTTIVASVTYTINGFITGGA